MKETIIIEYNKHPIFGKAEIGITTATFESDEEWNDKMAIRFRDRPLKGGETSNYYCDECGVDVHPDLRHSHKCGFKI